MVLPLLVLTTFGVFGLPQQLGNQHVEPPATTERLAGQIAVAPVREVHAHSVVLDRPGAPIEVDVNDATPICVAGHVGKLSELRAGQRVRISYDAVDGPPRANWIQVLPQPGSSP